MPTYTYQKEGEEPFELIMSIAEMKQYEKDNPDCERIYGAPALCDPVRMGIRKPHSGFSEVMHKIKSNHRGSTVDPGNVTDV